MDIERKPKMMGWRGASLLVPAVFSSVGFFAFGVLSFSFTEMATLPSWFRTGLVVTGAISLAAGSEAGTLSNVVEIYRKHDRVFWDWTALVISIMSTVMSFTLGFAALLGTSQGWSKALRDYGPIILGIVSAFDSYAGFCEFGLYLNSYDRRVSEWKAAILENSRSHVVMPKTNLQAGSEVLETIQEDVQVVQDTVKDDYSLSLRGITEDSSKLQRLDTMLRLFTVDPKMPTAQLANELDISTSTVYSYLKELEKAQVVKRNGSGVVLLPGAYR